MSTRKGLYPLKHLLDPFYDYLGVLLLISKSETPHCTGIKSDATGDVTGYYTRNTGTRATQSVVSKESSYFAL